MQSVKFLFFSYVVIWPINLSLNTQLQSSKILLLPPKYEIIMVPSNHPFFQYCDSNIALFSIALCKVITLNPLCILFGIRFLLLFWWLPFLSYRSCNYRNGMECYFQSQREKGLTEVQGHNFFPREWKISFRLDSLIFIWWNVHLFPQGFFIYLIFDMLWFFNGFIEKLQGEISKFLPGMAFPNLLMWRNNNPTALGKK